jgi:hypothetical protein
LISHSSDLACPKGQTFDKGTLGCKKCLEGTYSLGGGYQYTFDDSKKLVSTPELSFKASTLYSSTDSQCNKQK